MVGAIKYNLSHLLDFTGRDARQTFWLYILFLVVVQFVFGLLAMIPAMVSIMSGAFDAASNGASEGEMQVAMAADIGAMISQQVWISAGATLVSCFLFVAAFSRRLHDAGYPGWIAAIPVATSVYSVWHSVVMIDEAIAMAEAALANPEAASVAGFQQDASLASLIGWVGYLVVIGFGILKSQEGPNRYGDAPVRF